MINLKVIINKHYEVNLCDSKLIGSVINGTTVSSLFYGEKCSRENAINEIKKATMINALGEESVKLVKEVKGELKTMMLNGIPHLLLFTVT